MNWYTVLTGGVMYLWFTPQDRFKGPYLTEVPLYKLKKKKIPFFSLLFHMDYNLGDISILISSPGWSDTRFWPVGSCICGLLLKIGSKSPTLLRFHFINLKKKKKNSGDIWFICIHECSPQTMVLLEDTWAKLDWNISIVCDKHLLKHCCKRQINLVLKR